MTETLPCNKGYLTFARLLLLLLLTVQWSKAHKERHLISYASAVPVGFPSPPKDDGEDELLPSGEAPPDEPDDDPRDNPGPDDGEDGEDPLSNLVYIPRILVSALLAVAVLSFSAAWLYRRSRNGQSDPSSNAPPRQPNDSDAAA